MKTTESDSTLEGSSLHRLVSPGAESAIPARSLRLSIASTYDRRKTGDRYSVSSRLGDETICDRRPLADPFVRHRVRIHWWDAIKVLLRHGNITVEVSVDGDAEIIEDVLELDENYIGHGSTRRAEFRAGLEQALARHAGDYREEDFPEDEGPSTKHNIQ